MTQEELDNTYHELKKSWKTILNFLTAFAGENLFDEDGNPIINDENKDEMEEYKKAVNCAGELQDHINALRDHIEGKEKDKEC